MSRGLRERHDPEARVTALFEVLALFVGRVAADVTGHPLPTLAPRRRPRARAGTHRFRPAAEPVGSAPPAGWRPPDAGGVPGTTGVPDLAGLPDMAGVRDVADVADSPAA